VRGVFRAALDVAEPILSQGPESIVELACQMDSSIDEASDHFLRFCDCLPYGQHQRVRIAIARMEGSDVAEVLGEYAFKKQPS
jgi:hypothetical protein